MNFSVLFLLIWSFLWLISIILIYWIILHINGRINIRNWNIELSLHYRKTFQLGYGMHFLNMWLYLLICCSSTGQLNKLGSSEIYPHIINWFSIMFPLLRKIFPEKWYWHDWIFICRNTVKCDSYLTPYMKIKYIIDFTKKLKL